MSGRVNAEQKVVIVFQDGTRIGVVHGYIVDENDHFYEVEADTGRRLSIGKAFTHKIENVGG